MFIYLIVNHITGKYYVGQHKGNNLKKYLQDKFAAAKRKTSGNSHLFNSMRKYTDHSAWSIHALLSDVQTRPELDAYEKDFIAFLKSQDPEYGYNICRGGEGFTGPHTEQWKRNQSQKLKAIGHKPTTEATLRSIAVRQEIQEQTGIWPGAKPTDMTDTTINGIEILERLENTEDGYATWLCRCVCGKTFPASGHDLRSGHTQSCGCLKAEQNQINLSGGSRLKDMSGMVINGIEVLSRIGSLKRKNGRCRDTTWSCRCRCGTVFTARGSYIRSGHTKSCHCLQLAGRPPRVASRATK